jgi:Cof subfamily protein (haloacid dehalogenase superfamily)
MSGIALVVSDVDGTLVTTDKRLTDKSRAAVARLGAAGIAFSIVSSRPPFGLRSLIADLGLHLPVGAFNGAAVVMPDLTVLEQHALDRDAALRTLGALRTFGVDAWVFTVSRWLLDSPDGAYVGLERRTIGTDPTVASQLELHADHAVKIVGSSGDFARLDACEQALRRALTGSATVARSQRYYLDVTPPGFDKGTYLSALGRRLGVASTEIATLGDMENDIPMFRRSGFPIAMGNASDRVKQLAAASTLSNDHDGFAAAVDELILPQARGRGGAP